jgi:hypothetical protein
MFVEHGSSCFTLSTPILTPRGWVLLGELKRNDYVISFDERKQTTQISRVLLKKSPVESFIWNVYTTNSLTPIQTTMTHTFYTNSGLKRTSRLEPGDLLSACDDRGNVHRNYVEHVEKTCRKELVSTIITERNFNFAVEGALVHSFTYFRWLRGVWWNCKQRESHRGARIPAGDGRRIA